MTKGSKKAPSQRPGVAHLCINAKLLCGEKDIKNARYYRSHEYFLNQVEYCKACRYIFLAAFKNKK